MGCSCAGGSAGITVIKGLGSVGVLGSGTPTDPYLILDQEDSQQIAIQVRDTATVNMTAFGTGTQADPLVISADTSSAASLRGLGDVSISPVVAQGAVPLWIGSAAAGHFEFRTPGTRYTTNATRGDGLYQGEVIKETDTGKRYEWDGTQYVSLDVAAPVATDFSQVSVNRGTVASSVDWGTLLSPGSYRIGGWNSNLGTPPNAYNYGTLVVSVSGNSVTQAYFTHSVSNVYTRTKYGTSDWTPWRRLAAADELPTTATSTAIGFPGSVTSAGGNAVSRVGALATLVFSIGVGANGGSASSANSLMLAVPDGFQPAYSADATVSGNNNNGNAYSPVQVSLGTDGGLKIRGGSVAGNGFLYGTIPYICAS